MGAYTRSKIQEVHALVQRHGGWYSVFSRYSQLKDAMDNAQNGTSKAVPCPVRNEGKTVFRLYKDWEQCGGGYHNSEGRIGDGIDMVAWLEDTSKSKAMDIILEILGEDVNNVSQREVKAVVQHREKSTQISATELKKRMWILTKVEREAVHVTQSPIGMNYLRSRGLGDIDIPCCVGFHPKMKAWRNDGTEIWIPALVFYIQKLDGTAIAFHRIYLTEDGSGKSKEMDTPKMQMKATEDMRGGSIQLGMPLVCHDEYGNTRIVLGTGEGPETCMACQHVEGIPVWSGLSSTIMDGMHIPMEVTDLVIFKDKDTLHDGQEMPEGDRAALELKRLVQETNPNCKVTIATPPSAIKPGAKSQDWLDEWNETRSQNFIHYLQKNKLTPVGYLERADDNQAA